MEKYKKIVIKVGTKVITSKDRTLDTYKMKEMVGQIADILDRGSKVILVTSGAIGAGMGLLGLKRRPDDLSRLQAAASIGQSYLMQIYNEYFKSRGYISGQILLTQEDFNDRKRYLNIKHTIDKLLEYNAVPVINENDTVATDEIKCGDNDRLSSLVSDLCQADLLMLLTDVEGLLDEEGNCVRFVGEITPKISKLAVARPCDLGTGGMATKLESVKAAMGAGVDCVIANGRIKDIILKITKGEAVGTTFKSQKARFIAKKRWIAFSSKPKGAIRIDDGARLALLEKDKSLLASGISAVSGDFKSGDVVSILDSTGAEIARGVVGYSSEEVSKIKGMRSGKFSSVLGYGGRDEVIHKDNLVLL